MSVYGTYGGLPGWVIDAVYNTSLPADNDNNNKILSGRFVVLKTETESGEEVSSLYQRTPGSGTPTGWTKIFGAINAPNITGATISYPAPTSIPPTDTVEYEDGVLIFQFPSLKAIHDASNSLTIHAAPLEYNKTNSTLYNKGFGGVAQDGVVLTSTGSIQFNSENVSDLNIGTYWKVL